MPDLFKTRSELTSRAARKARLIAAGQTLETEDATVIDGAIDGVLADLAARNVFYVANDEEIPIEAFEHLAGILAEQIGPDWGKATDENHVLLLESKLRVISSAGPTFEVLKTDYF